MTEIVKFRDEYEEMQIEITLNLTFIRFQTNPNLAAGSQRSADQKLDQRNFWKIDQTLVTRADSGPVQVDPNGDLENGPELIMRLEVDLDQVQVEPWPVFLDYLSYSISNEKVR